MGLAEVQDALAKLAIDPVLRDRFFADEAAARAELRLTAEETSALKRMPRQPLEQFADSLRRKRRGQVRRALPLTARALGEAFPVWFERYLDSSPPRGCKPDLDDAEGFAASLVHLGHPLEPRWAAELARYELAWHQAADPGRPVIIRIFRYPVQHLAKRMNDTERLGRRQTLACWWRPTRRGRVLHICWSAPGLSVWGRAAWHRAAPLG